MSVKNWETQDYMDSYVCFVKVDTKEGHMEIIASNAC